MTTKQIKHGTEQEIDVLDQDNQKESITIETIDNQVSIGMSSTDKFGDEHWACATLDRAQLWEHIHNCLDALEGLK